RVNILNISDLHSKSGSKKIRLKKRPDFFYFIFIIRIVPPEGRTRLKKFQLLRHRRQSGGGFAAEIFHHAELLVRNSQNADMAFLRKLLFYALDMYICIFPAAAMSYVNRELELPEPVLQNVFTEFRVNLPFFFGFGRQVKKYKYPQDPVLV